MQVMSSHGITRRRTRSRRLLLFGWWRGRRPLVRMKSEMPPAFPPAVQVTLLLVT